MNNLVFKDLLKLETPEKVMKKFKREWGKYTKETKTMDLNEFTLYDEARICLKHLFYFYNLGVVNSAKFKVFLEKIVNAVQRYAIGEFFTINDVLKNCINNY